MTSLAEMSTVSIASQKVPGGGGVGGRVGVGLTLKKKRCGEIVVSRVKLRGPVSAHIHTYTHAHMHTYA